uniref:Glutathione peroxidase n=1 Tax=Panagrolaimus sp. ES5 TaxID=591445 RepID=A0AC34GUC8_9BILA
MFKHILFAAACLFVAFAKESPGPKLIDETSRWSECKDANQSIYDFQVETLQGEFTDLSQYKGQVLLVINVATFCAYTQQYVDFNPLIEKNIENGAKFSIVAFPCNQFYLQEPAENHELMDGITKVRPGNGWKPHRNLHIYGKVEVNGVDHHPLYEYLKLIKMVDHDSASIQLPGVMEKSFNLSLNNSWKKMHKLPKPSYYHSCYTRLIKKIIS